MRYTQPALFDVDAALRFNWCSDNCGLPASVHVENTDGTVRCVPRERCRICERCSIGGWHKCRPEAA